MLNENLHERIRRLAEERQRIAEEEDLIRTQAQQELERVIGEIEVLEEKREALETFLGVNSEKRLQRGVIRDLCFDILARNPQGLTSSQLRDLMEKEAPGMNLVSLPSTLSRQSAQGKIYRDAQGRYFMTEVDDWRGDNRL